MNNLLVISSYPEKNETHGKRTVGVASYAKNTLTAVASTLTGKEKITVLAEKLPASRGYTDGRIRVRRIWERGSLLSFPFLIREIMRNHKKERTVLVEFELAMFGGLLTLILFPLFLLTLRLMGKRTTVVCHQVIPNIVEIGPHINISEQSWGTLLINAGIAIFYRLLLLTAHSVVVFEESLKKRLCRFGNGRKIIVIPHGVETITHPPRKQAARKTLGIQRDEFVVVVFGYLAWYKGTDWIAHEIAQLNAQRKKKITLVLAGGPNPNHANKPFYLKYLSNLTALAEEHNITITGYVAEQDIALYYMSSDVVLLPYKTFMSASGPLAFALSFGKPFLLSPVLKPSLTMPDVARALTELKLHDHDIHFADFNGDFRKKIAKLQSNYSYRKRLTMLSRRLGQARRWDQIGQKYHETLFS